LQPAGHALNSVSETPSGHARDAGISVVIVTKNAVRHLAEVLESVRNFPEVVIYDNGSTDETLAVAARYPNVTIHHGPFIGFGPLKNAAVGRASRDWILSIDDDEVLSEALAAEILSLDLDDSKVYALPFRNHFCGRWIRGCGWHPQVKKRLFHRRRAHFDDAKVHEALQHEGLEVVQLDNPVLHYTADSVADLQEKERLYSALFAEQWAGRRRSTIATALVKGAFAFFKSYILERGIACGADGYVISAHAGIAKFYRYLKLREANARLR
jgi:glycosyltransferase involved in cell wall biosynthesis